MVLDLLRVAMICDLRLRMVVVSSSGVVRKKLGCLLPLNGRTG